MLLNLLCRNLNKLLIRKELCSNLSSTVLLDGKEVKEVSPKRHGKMNTIYTIQELMNLNYRKALNIVNKNKELIKRNGSILSKNHAILVNLIDEKTILKYPLLLGTEYLEDAINELKSLPYSIEDTIVLACLVRIKFDKLISNFKKQDDKIELLSTLLQVSYDLACEYLYNKDFLINKDPKIFEDILKLILDFGIPLEEVRKDLWVFKYSHQLIAARIKLIKQENIEIDSPKPWMLRSPMKVIEKYAKRRTDNRQILGNASLTEYLSQKLECTEDQAQYLITKMPALRTKSLKTLSDIINFLYSKDFHSYHIYRVPKILVHSVETTKKRLEQLEKSGNKVDSLYMLTKSQKQFNQYYDALVKSKRSV